MGPVCQDGRPEHGEFAGGVLGRPRRRGWARWNALVETSRKVAAPPGLSHRRLTGVEFLRRPAHDHDGEDEPEGEERNGDHWERAELTAVAEKGSGRPEEQRRRRN